MEGQHHDLAHEFPDFKDKIHQLKISDQHFSNLAKHYEELDKQIARAEKRIECISELDEEKLRKERLNLKEKIYAMLTASAA